MPTEIAGWVAIVNVCGPLDHHNQWWLDSYDSIVERAGDAFGDPDVLAVIMRFDSPGGDASGVEEAHRRLRAMRAQSKKPLFAYADESCYSAAYWLACAADGIWLPRTGGVGSVGVIAEAYDVTHANEKAGVRVELVTTGKQKADGHPERPLTDEILGRVQTRVDKLGQIFFASVAEARGLKPQAVEDLQAACLMGDEAVGAGLADDVISWEKFLELVRASVA
jgi:ClpP class serine protease